LIRGSPAASNSSARACAARSAWPTSRAAAALSTGRFRHLFVRETGVAFRPYVLWLRLNVAIECSMQGRSWTEAAHEAGFADSAHLSRTFRRMFGMNPATLVRE
jgi:AraC-like DNA-binding protein